MLPGSPDGRRPRPTRRRVPGELSTAEFLRGVLEAAQARLPGQLQQLETRHQGSLIKLWRDEPAIHFEMAVHHARGRVELALHFETRDAKRNRQLLEYVADDLPFLKEALGAGLEAEPWDKGWTRLYLTRPVERLGVEEQARLAAAFAEFIEVLEPISQEAAAAVGSA
jgi:hypothetical protein